MKIDARFVVPAAALAMALVSGPVMAQAQDPGADRSAQAQAQSQQSQDQAETKTAQGELLRVDAEKHMFWIKGADDKEMEFGYTDDTEVTGEAENVEGLSTEAGSRVSVEYRTEGENAVATKIAIQPEADAVAPSAPAPSPQE